MGRTGELSLVRELVQVVCDEVREHGGAELRAQRRRRRRQNEAQVQERLRRLELEVRLVAARPLLASRMRQGVGSSAG